MRALVKHSLLSAAARPALTFHYGGDDCTRAMRRGGRGDDWSMQQRCPRAPRCAPSHPGCSAAALSIVGARLRVALLRFPSPHISPALLPACLRGIFPR